MARKLTPVEEFVIDHYEDYYRMYETQLGMNDWVSSVLKEVEEILHEKPWWTQKLSSFLGEDELYLSNPKWISGKSNSPVQIGVYRVQLDCLAEDWMPISGIWAAEATNAKLSLEKLAPKCGLNLDKTVRHLQGYDKGDREGYILLESLLVKQEAPKVFKTTNHLRDRIVKTFDRYAKFIPKLDKAFRDR